MVVFVARKSAVNLNRSIRSLLVTVQNRCFAHYILWMPIHNGILEIEPLEIGDGSGLYFLRKAKHSAELGDFREIEFDEQNLFIRAQERDVGGRSWLELRNELQIPVANIVTNNLIKVKSVANSGYRGLVEFLAYVCQAPGRKAPVAKLGTSLIKRLFLLLLLFGVCDRCGRVCCLMRHGYHGLEQRLHRDPVT